MRAKNLIVIMIFSMVLLNSCSSMAENRIDVKINPDSLITKIVGDTVADVLFSPKSVTLYLSENRKKENDKEVEIADGFVRDTLVAKLKAEDVSILQFVLLSDTLNYAIDSVQIKSPYMPFYEFVFIKKKENVQVLISLSNNYWEIKHNNETVCKYNFACKSQLERFLTLLFNL